MTNASGMRKRSVTNIGKFGTENLEVPLLTIEQTSEFEYWQGMVVTL